MEGRRQLREITSGSNGQGWRFFERRPGRHLARFVRDLHGYTEHGLGAVIRKETPVASIPVIFVFGPGFTLHETGSTRPVRVLQRSFAVGLHGKPSLVGSLGNSICLQANLTMSGARRFFGRGLHYMSGEIVDLNHLLPRCSDLIESQLEEAGSWPERFDILEAFLADRIFEQSAGHTIAIEACRLLSSSGGRVGIESIARHLDCSRKHLNNVFKSEIGMSAKAFARLQRFENASVCLREFPSEQLSAIAHDCGYADQAHFNREFRSFAGETPGKFRAREGATGLVAEAVRR